jgi:RND superfamily putative drug exporter
MRTAAARPIPISFMSRIGSVAKIEDGGENRFWSAGLTPALRRPAVAAVGATAVLLALATPVMHVHTSQTGLDALPKNFGTVETIDRRRSPDGPSPRPPSWR